jgi:hypothetical protein
MSPLCDSYAGPLISPGAFTYASTMRSPTMYTSAAPVPIGYMAGFCGN